MLVLVLLSSLLIANESWATGIVITDAQMDYSGVVADDSGAPFSLKDVYIRAEIKVQNCLLYSKTVAMQTGAGGEVSINISNTGASFPSSAFALTDLMNKTSGLSCSSGTYTSPLAPGTARQLTVSLARRDTGFDGTVYEVIDTEPLRPAYQALDSLSLGGELPSAFARITDIGKVATSAPSPAASGVLWSDSGTLKFYDQNGVAQSVLGSTQSVTFPSVTPAVNGSYAVASTNGSLSWAAPLWTANGTTSISSTVAKVGIGVAVPTVALHVVGDTYLEGGGLSADKAIVSKSKDNTSSTIDFSLGNLQTTTASCGAIVLNGMKAGGAYSLLISGTTAATCSFTAFSDAGTTALTVKMPPDHDATVAGKMTLYNFMVYGSTVFVSWSPGY